ncbi:MAG: hypothetical protein WBL28_11650 [Methylotenera sp.]
MSETTQITSRSYFEDLGGFTALDWLVPLQPIVLPRRINVTLRTYADICDVTIDIGGPAVYLDCCQIGGYDFNFTEGDGVLRANKTPINYSIRLTFSPAIQAVGTQISAVGPLDVDYIGQLHVDMDASNWDYWETKTRGTLNQVRGSAPFLGAVAKQGKGITGAWFDLKSTDRVNFLQVAINTLYILP